MVKAFLVSVTTVLLCFSAEADVKAVDWEKIIQFKVDKMVLDNGLTVLFHVDRSAPIYSYHQWFRVGSKDEKPGQTGIAHFFEHLMFKGTKKYPTGTFDKILQSNGGVNNAFTSRDYTGYYENMPSGTLDLVIDIESDRMQNLLFDEKLVQSEREVVKEERRWRVENSVRGSLSEAVYKTVYKVHNYRWPVIGYMADLNATSIDDLKKFYRTYYAPNNSVIVIAGDFDLNSAKAMIKKKYGSIPAQKLPERKLASEPEQQGSRQTIVKKDVQSTTFAVVFKASKAGEKDSYALDLLSNILSRGNSSRLYKRLVYKEKILTSISAWAYTPIYPGVFQVTGSMKPGQDVSRALRSVYGELYKVRNRKVLADELAKAKNQMMFDYVQGLMTVSGKARALALSEIIFGDYQLVFKDLSIYNSITPDDILRVSKKYLLPQRRSLVMVQPKGV